MRVLMSLCLVLCTCVWVGQPWALSLKRPTFAVLTKKSIHVVKAKVVSIRTQVAAKGLPFTWTDFQVSHVYKGTQIKQLSLRLVGMSSGQYRLLIPGVPRFRVGEEVILCTRRYPHAASPVLVALSYGVFDLKKTPKGLLVKNRGGLTVPADWASFEVLLRRTIANQTPFVKTPMNAVGPPQRRAPVRKAPTPRPTSP